MIEGNDQGYDSCLSHNSSVQQSRCSHNMGQRIDKSLPWQAGLHVCEQCHDRHPSTDQLSLPHYASHRLSMNGVHCKDERSQKALGLLPVSRQPLLIHPCTSRPAFVAEQNRGVFRNAGELRMP